ncbi:MAG TPA: hypothetical protein VEI02_03805 [Planctomycetota bacterium]|nr:hypothetical protein [Planctomycetota bacterium]
MFRRGAASVLLLACAACSVAPPPLPADAPLDAVLARHGEAATVPAEPVDSRPSPLEVVLVRDRHFAGDGITYVDEGLRAVQREHRRLLDDLVGRGFRLLAVEWRKGPLPGDDDPLAAAHRDAVRRALETGDDLDRWSIYQPIRYEMELAGRAVVVGVEDPELYDADVAALERLLDLARASRLDEGTDGGARDAGRLAERARIRRAMRLRIAPRGRAVARNLLLAMEAYDARRAVLLVGAAHVPAASAELAARGVPHRVFTTRSFAKREDSAPVRP